MNPIKKLSHLLWNRFGIDTDPVLKRVEWVINPKYRARQKKKKK